MSVSTYMQLCLSHPTDGYYMNPRNFIFGLDGDFITSPEISQVFGEVRRQNPAFFTDHANDEQQYPLSS